MQFGKHLRHQLIPCMASSRPCQLHPPLSERNIKLIWPALDGITCWSLPTYLFCSSNGPQVRAPNKISCSIRGFLQTRPSMQAILPTGRILLTSKRVREPKKAECQRVIWSSRRQGQAGATQAAMGPLLAASKVPTARRSEKETKRDQRGKMRNVAGSRRPAGVSCCPLEAQRTHATALTTGTKGPSQG